VIDLNSNAAYQQTIARLSTNKPLPFLTADELIFLAGVAALTAAEEHRPEHRFDRIAELLPPAFFDRVMVRARSLVEKTKKPKEKGAFVALATALAYNGDLTCLAALRQFSPVWRSREEQEVVEQALANRELEDGLPNYREYLQSQNEALAANWVESARQMLVDAKRLMPRETPQSTLSGT
jgi:hypothetical protein